MKITFGLIGFIFLFFGQIGLAGDLPNDTTWQDTEDSSKTTGNAYFRGRPLPECREFWILEEHFEGQLHGQNNFGDRDRITVSTDFGKMFNLSRSHALGGAFFINSNENCDYLGFRFRYRCWITKDLSWDLAPGLIFAAEIGSRDGQFQFPGLSAGTYLCYRDWVGLNLTLESYKTEARDALQTGHSVTALYGGVTLGSYPAVAGIAATIIVLVFSSRSITLD